MLQNFQKLRFLLQLIPQILFISTVGFSQQGTDCGIFLYPGDSTSTDSSIREFVKVRALADGSIIHAGQADEGANADFSLCKTSQDGSIFWQKKMGTPGLDVLKNFIVTRSGDFVLVGWTVASPGGFSDALVVRLNAAGEPEWVRTFGGANDDDDGFGITELSDGNLLLTGTTFSFGPKLKNAFAARLDSAGDLIWSKAYAKGNYNYFLDAIALPDGEAIACGYTWNTSGGAIFDPMFVKLNPQGEPVWSSWIKMAGSQIVYDYEKDADGGIVFAGVSTITGAPNQNFISKVNASGQHQWTRLFGTPNGDRVWDLAVLPNGKYLAAGFAGKTPADASVRNGFVTRLSADGAVEESLLVGTEDTVTTTFTGIAISDDYLIANGFSYKNGHSTGAGIALKVPAMDFSQVCGAEPVTMTSSVLTGIDSAGILTGEGGGLEEPVFSVAANNLIRESICVFTDAQDIFSAPVAVVFPNPGNGLFQVQGADIGAGSAFQVLNAEGRIVCEGNFESAQLDLRFLPDGLYLFRISRKNKTDSFRLVKSTGQLH